MYKCESCGCKFIDPVKSEEYRGEFWGVPAYETVGSCPCCGDDDYREVDEYDECYYEGEYDDQDCYGCPYKEDCSGYTGDEFDDE